MRVSKITRTLALRWTPKNPKRDPWLLCSAVPGLCLRVRPVRGRQWRREWYVRYQWHRRTRHKCLGPIEEWTLEEAAEAVRKHRKRVRQAHLEGSPDPLRLPAPSTEQRHTVSDLATEYQSHSTKAVSSQKEESRKWEKLLELEIRGAVFGSLPILEVLPAHIWELRKTMEDTPVAFNRTRSLLHHAFNMAPRFGLVEPSDLVRWENPCKQVQKFPEKRRERTYSIEEYRGLRRVLDQILAETLEKARQGNRHAKFKCRSLLSFRILARTGLRPVELRRLRKDEVRWSQGFADTRNAKADRGGSEGRILAFGPAALEDLRLMSELSVGSSPFLLPSWVDPGKPMDPSGTRTPWRELKEKVDELSGLNLRSDREATRYALRHTIINQHAYAGIDIADMADLVDHRTAKQGTTHIYRHTKAPRMIELATLLESHMDSLVTADQP